MNTLESIETALRRQRKRFAHSLAALQAAETETARKRHARRLMNAQRGLKEAERTLGVVAFERA